MKLEKSEKDLSSQEEKFCQLYVYGGQEFAGKSLKCYTEVFGDKNKYPYAASKYLLTKPNVQSKVKELNVVLMQSEEETIAVKLQVTETLKAVMEETATAQFTDKWGVSISPAPLRAVAVNAAKALMDLYPIKHKQDAKLKIEGVDGNVIFNVIVPEQSKKNEVEGTKI